jgi:hypothetical protein
MRDHFERQQYGSPTIVFKNRNSARSSLRRHRQEHRGLNPLSSTTHALDHTHFPSPAISADFRPYVRRVKHLAVRPTACPIRGLVG